MILKEQISYTEGKWLVSVSSHIRSLLENIHLPSHDFAHHCRVWENLKTILHLQDYREGEPGPKFITQALLGAFFHDTGMIRDRGPAHGCASRRLLEDYLKLRKLEPAMFATALEAVETHDDKTYSGNISPLTGLLGMADDLDAFGRIGAIRYAEIFLYRGGNPPEAARWVIPNLENRLRHLESRFPPGHPWINEQKKRCQLTRDFFSEEEFFLPVLRLVEEVVIKEKSTYAGLCRKAARTRLPDAASTFFGGLRKELQTGNDCHPSGISLT